MAKWNFFSDLPERGRDYWFVHSVLKVLSAEIPTSCFYIKLNFILCGKSLKNITSKKRKKRKESKMMLFFRKLFFMNLEYFYKVSTFKYNIGKRLQKYMKSRKQDKYRKKFSKISILFIFFMNLFILSFKIFW